MQTWLSEVRKPGWQRCPTYFYNPLNLSLIRHRYLSDFLIKILYRFVIYSVLVACAVRFIFPMLITLLMYGEVYKL
jgi:hypothetical protein